MHHAVGRPIQLSCTWIQSLLASCSTCDILDVAISIRLAKVHQVACRGAYWCLPVPSQRSASAARRPRPPQMRSSLYRQRALTIDYGLEMPAGYACSSCSTISRACERADVWRRHRHHRRQCCAAAAVVAEAASGLRLISLTMAGMP
jgi:hypothetical protein